MGLMRYLVPDRQRLSDSALERAYLVGPDDVPWLSRATWQDDLLVVERAEDDSCNLHIPWSAPGHAELSLSTTSLMERAAPYHLPVELARGTIHRLRNQIAGWEAAGLTVRESVARNLASALAHFAQAATRQQDPSAAAQSADAAVAAALQAISELCGGFVEQSLAVRRRQPVKSHVLFAVDLGSEPLKPAVSSAIMSSINAAVVPMTWKNIAGSEDRRDWSLSDAQVAWCHEHNLRVSSGPLLKLERSALPDWLFLWDGDAENLINMATEHVRSVVSRYRGKVHLWQCAARMNVGGVLSLSEQQCLRLSALAIEAIRAIDQRTPIVLSVDQPWGEFMNRHACELAPFHFADTLVRYEMGLTAVSLEINLGYWPGGSQPRDLLDFNRLIDRWTTLERPLVVQLTIPSGRRPDPRASSAAPTILAGDPAGDSEPNGATQRDWLQSIVSLLCSKPSVCGIIWNQLTDSMPHEFAHGGLFDENDQPKPALAALLAMRERYA